MACSHRAVLSCCEAAKVLKKVVEGPREDIEVDDDPGATKIWFGKHFGKHFDSLPEEYRRWLLLTYCNESAKGAPSPNFARIKAMYDKWTVKLDQDTSPFSTIVWFGKFKGLEIRKPHQNRGLWRWTREHQSEWAPDLLEIERRYWEWLKRRPPRKATEKKSRGHVEVGEKLGPWNDDQSDVGSYQSDDGFVVCTDEENRSDESNEDSDLSDDEQSGSEAGNGACSTVSERNSPEVNAGEDHETSATSPNITNLSNESESSSRSSSIHGGSPDVNNQQPITPSKRRLMSRKERDDLQNSPSKKVPLMEADMNTVSCANSDSESSPISPQKKFRTPRSMRHQNSPFVTSSDIKAPNSKDQVFISQQSDSQSQKPAGLDSDDGVLRLRRPCRIKSACKVVNHVSQLDSDDEVLRPSTLRKRRRFDEVVEMGADDEDTIDVESPSKRRRARRN